MRYNGFYYALFRGTMKKVLVEHYGKSFAADTMHRTKGIYKNWWWTGTTRWLSTVCGSATVNGVLFPEQRI